MERQNNNVELGSRVFEDAEKLANNWRIEGQWENALTLLRGLRPVANQLGDAALARMGLAVAHVLMNQDLFGGFDTLSEREEILDTALKHAEAVGEPSLIGKVWNAKGSSLHAAYLNGDRREEPEHELEFFERGLALRRKVNSPGEVAESLFWIGIVYGVVRKDHDQALPYFEEAYHLAQEAGDLIMTSYAIRHIGFAHYEAGDIEAARADFEESLRLREATHFKPGVGAALTTLGLLEAEQGNKAKALAKLERARSILKSLGNSWVIERIDETITNLSSEL